MENAGVVPRKVMMMRALHALRQTIDATIEPERLRTLRRRASDLQKAIALRLERLKRGDLQRAEGTSADS